MKEKLVKVATTAAAEATLNERGRCLWVLDAILEELRQRLPKVMLNETQRHLMETKIKICVGIIREARRRITAGDRPTQKENGGHGKGASMEERDAAGQDTVD